jgi:hypothetical protein
MEMIGFVLEAPREFHLPLRNNVVGVFQESLRRNLKKIDTLQSAGLSPLTASIRRRFFKTDGDRADTPCMHRSM